MDEQDILSSGSLDSQDQPQIVSSASETSQPYIGRWNHLVSRTNWEKGRIILQWREALIDDGTEAAEYSDEAWSRLVGGVTGQHVGRLRRVYQRFGQSHEDYEGLYWSHFQAAIDWDDAEMWLEGAIQNRWSVSAMRRQRWETLGSDPLSEPDDGQVVTADLDEDFEPALEQPVADVVAGAYDEVSGGRKADNTVERAVDPEDDPSAEDTHENGAAIYANDPEDTIQFVRPFENIAALPADLADAFEEFKLAILRHKAENWRQIAPDDVLAVLDALKELVLAPTVEETRF